MEGRGSTRATKSEIISSGVVLLTEAHDKARSLELLQLTRHVAMRRRWQNMSLRIVLHTDGPEPRFQVVKPMRGYDATL